MFELLNEEMDDDLKQDLSEELSSLEQSVEEFELVILLNQAYDQSNAILELHPGAGGTESPKILLKCYFGCIRWIEQRGFSYEILDYQSGDRAGIKSVTILVKGEYLMAC